MLRSRWSRFGARVFDEMLGSCERSAREEGKSRAVFEGGA